MYISSDILKGHLMPEGTRAKNKQYELLMKGHRQPQKVLKGQRGQADGIKSVT